MQMSQETKASLTILIREVGDCKTLEKVRTLLDSWITANDLHPEEVETFASLEEALNSLQEG